MVLGEGDMSTYTIIGNRRVLLAVACVAIVGVAVALAQGRTDSGSAVAVTESPSNLDREMAVFSHGRASSDALPAELASTLPRTLGQSGGDVRSNDSRKALSVDDHRSVYVVPTSDGVCAALTNGTGAGVHCVGDGQLAVGVQKPSSLYSGCEVEDESGVPRCKSVALYGLVPDGIEKVLAKLSDGSVVTGTVGGNAYVIDSAASNEPVSVTYQDDSGTRQTVVVSGR
jgi:hypothetical protein